MINVKSKGGFGVKIVPKPNIIMKLKKSGLLAVFYGVSTVVGYLMPTPAYIYIYIYIYIYMVLLLVHILNIALKSVFFVLRTF